MTTNLLIATHNGINRLEPFNKLKLTLDHYAANNNTFTQITVIVGCHSPRNVNTSYNLFLTKLEEMYPTLPLKIHFVANDLRFLSYSSYYEGWKLYPNFDTYIFCEDDYIFIQEDNSNVCANLINNVDYIFAKIEDVPHHASHAIGIARGTILTTVFDNFYHEMNQTNAIHQIAFSQIFFKHKQYKYTDMQTTKYTTPFHCTGDRRTILLHTPVDSINHIFMSVQYFYYNNISISDALKYKDVQLHIRN
jgi:hypothetical protein